MNCDQAFDLMTTPPARDSHALAGHLARCRRCRDMQNALSPALESFADARRQPRNEIPTPSTARPWLSVEALAVAEQASRRLTRPLRPAPRSYLSWASSVAIAGFAGAILGAFAVRDARPNHAALATIAEPSMLTACLWTEERSRNHAAGSGQSPRSVVASCVLCHVPADFQ